VAIASHAKKTHDRPAILTADIHTFRLQQQIETVLHLMRICNTEYLTDLFIVADSAYWPDYTIEFDLPPPRIVNQDWQAYTTDDSLTMAHNDEDDDPMDDCSYDDDGFWVDDEHVDAEHACEVFWSYQSMPTPQHESMPMQDEQQKAIQPPDSHDGSTHPGKTTHHWHTHSPSESKPEPKTHADITATTTPPGHFTQWNIKARPS
jgi:hypothetical protein